MLSALQAIPIGKIAYSAVILAIIIFFAREFFVVWFDDRIYVGRFEYFADGKRNDDLTTTFPLSVLAQHHMLRSALIDEVRRRTTQRPANLPAVARTFQALPASSDPAEHREERRG